MLPVGTFVIGGNTYKSISCNRSFPFEDLRVGKECHNTQGNVGERSFFKGWKTIKKPSPGCLFELLLSNDPHAIKTLSIKTCDGMV